MFETARLTSQVQSSVANPQARLAKTSPAVRDGYGFRKSEKWLGLTQAYYALVATSPLEFCWYHGYCMRERGFPAVLEAVVNEVLALDGVRDTVLARVRALHEQGGSVAAELRKLDKNEKSLCRQSCGPGSGSWRSRRTGSKSFRVRPSCSSI